VESFRIERLGGQHDRSAFSCGTPTLDDWLRQFAGQHDRRGLSRTYVAVRPPESKVLGYYCLSSHHVRYDVLTQDAEPQTARLPRHVDVPVVLIGRLAVDQSVRGQGLGSALVINAFRRILALADQIGIRAVEVDALDDHALRFWHHLGFVALSDRPTHLYYSLNTVRALGLEPINE
jgi:GNAT superfamily N-acetyltransferase